MPDAISYDMPYFEANALAAAGYPNVPKTWRRGDLFVLEKARNTLAATQPVGLHLAVFAEPFLSLVLEGHKTTESRFSRTRCAPFDVVRNGDIILVKEVGGPVCGLAVASRALFFDLKYEPITRIREEYGSAIGGDDEFWEQKRHASYATLIDLAEPVAIADFPCGKRDRRGWVALTPLQLTLAF
jgi:hypothetical protein